MILTVTKKDQRIQRKGEQQSQENSKPVETETDPVEAATQEQLAASQGYLLDLPGGFNSIFPGFFFVLKKSKFDDCRISVKPKTKFRPNGCKKPGVTQGNLNDKI